MLVGSCCGRDHDHPCYPDIDLAYHRSLCKNAAYCSIPCNGWVAGKSRDDSAGKSYKEFPAYSSASCKTVLPCGPCKMAPAYNSASCKTVPPCGPCKMAASFEPCKKVPAYGSFDKMESCKRVLPYEPCRWVPAFDKKAYCKMIPCSC